MAGLLIRRFRLSRTGPSIVRPSTIDRAARHSGCWCSLIARDETDASGPSETGEIALAILSYNNAGIIGNTIRAAREGLAVHFANRNFVLINADGGSRDGTQDAAREAAGSETHFVQTGYTVNAAQKFSPEYYGVPGKMSALRSVCEVARERGDSACAAIDASVQTVTPDWVQALLHPVTAGGFDLVRPCYLRHKYDGAILTGIVYPLTRALYGRRVLQPMGGEVAFSGRLAEHLLKQRWDGDLSAPGSDVWLTTQAFGGKFRVAQSFLGPRTVATAEPAPEVSTVLNHALSAILAEMEKTAPIWQRVRGSEETPSFGPCGEVSADPAALDVYPMIHSFQLGYRNLQDIWRLVLPPATMLDLKRLSLLPFESFRLADALWARIVYDFALGWRLRTIDRDHLLGSLTPLYLGWAASYLWSIREADAVQTRERAEAVSLAFETQKNYLISRWRWPDRFNP
jgi:hypothetical protein